ncbi:DUF3990 domain-containing protein [Allobaculum sp. JKK-2023]|uniref:DUF3990 domain-containing protein n=1 Tax=Allobaculum sp. JKK-2023 TaxID=3108943 RepID=UPI002B05B71E|nr:DUF3990 domain-containing protein [Allobaculum sp. JKK-2023]
MGRIASSLNKVSLFHGSKSGLKGEIKPISRERCDFGAGFYMGTDVWQPLTLVYNFENPVLYTLTFDMSGLNVLHLKPDLTWALTIAYYRGKLEPFKSHPIYRAIQEYVSGYDVIVGPIADDRMFVVLDRFFKGDITDQALIHCLSGLDLGYQYVAVSEKACGQIKIQSERKLGIEEKENLKTLSISNRKAGLQLVESVSKQYRRSGRYFDEIVEDWNEFEFGSKTAL